jgi:hypothetical protein
MAAETLLAHVFGNKFADLLPYRGRRPSPAGAAADNSSKMKG